MSAYKYNPEDYEELLKEYMTAFYRAYEEQNRGEALSLFADLYNETKYVMKNGEISSDRREDMLAYFGEMIPDA